MGRSRAGETRELLDSFGTVIRQLTRLTGGPDEGPAMVSPAREVDVTWGRSQLELV